MIDDLLALIEQARAIHTESEWWDGWCRVCLDELPCPTLRLAEALEQESIRHAYTAADRDNLSNWLAAANEAKDLAEARSADLERENALLLDIAAKIEVAEDGHLEHCSCAQSVALLAARVERLAAVVEAIRVLEWTGDIFLESGTGYCFMCGNVKPEGHVADCPLSAALGLAAGEES